MRRDDVWKQPNVFKARLAAAAVACESARAAQGRLAVQNCTRIDPGPWASAECRRIGAALAVALRTALVRVQRYGLVEPFGNPSPLTPREPFRKGSERVPQRVAEPIREPRGNPPWDVREGDSEIISSWGYQSSSGS